VSNQPGIKVYITSHCTVYKGYVYKNSQPLFSMPAGSPTEFLTAAYQHFSLQYPKFYKMDNLGKLGWLANEVLLNDSFNTQKYKPEEVGVIFCNASASLDTDIRYYETVRTIPSPALFVYTLPNIVIGEICIRHGFKGENGFFISTGFDVGFIEQYVSSLVNNNILQACICGWVELLENEYKATLFLVEKDMTGDCVTFTEENLNKIYQLHDG
jgi:hypothetical protein